MNWALFVAGPTWEWDNTGEFVKGFGSFANVLPVVGREYVWAPYDGGVVAATIPSSGQMNNYIFRIPFGATEADMLCTYPNLAFVDMNQFDTLLACSSDGSRVAMSQPYIAGSRYVYFDGLQVFTTTGIPAVRHLDFIMLNGSNVVLAGKDGDGGRIVPVIAAATGALVTQYDPTWTSESDVVMPSGYTDDTGRVVLMSREDAGEAPNDVLVYENGFSVAEFAPVPQNPPGSGSNSPYVSPRWPIAITSDKVVLLYGTPGPNAIKFWFIVEYDVPSQTFGAPVPADVAGIDMPQQFWVTNEYRITARFGPTVVGTGPLRLTSIGNNSNAYLSVNGGGTYSPLQVLTEQDDLARFIWQAPARPLAPPFWTRFIGTRENVGFLDELLPSGWRPRLSHSGPANNYFADAIAIPSVTVNTGNCWLSGQTLLSATLEQLEPAAGASDGSVWYSWVCPAGTVGMLDVWAQTNDTFNTTCDVYTGASLATLVSAATGTYTFVENVVATSTVSMFNPVDNQTFYVRVRRTGAGAGGPFDVFIDYD